MRSTLRQIDDPHDAPIAPDIVPAEWAELQPAKPANQAASREKLFAEIRHAAETAAPQVDNSFRASDVNDIPAPKKKSSRAWIKSAVTAFVLALFSALAAAAWKHHGEAATETLAALVPLPSANSSAAAEPATDANAQPETQAPVAQPAAGPSASSSTATLPPEAEQQIQSMARDLAAMGQQIEQLKATIETLKANQQAAVAPSAPSVTRPPAPKPRVTALPPRPVQAPHPPRQNHPAIQAAAAPPPPAAAAPPPAYPPPPQAYPPPQATTQPNGEPVVRPPMPMPLSDRY